MRQTLDFAQSLRLSRAWFSHMVPFPGTPVWDEGVEKYGRIVNDDMSEWGNKNVVFVPKDMEVEQLNDGMKEAQKIRREIRRRSYNLLPSVRRKWDELAIVAHNSINRDRTPRRALSPLDITPQATPR